MPNLSKSSPTRPHGGINTRGPKSRRSRSLCSPALSTASGRLTSLIDQFKDKNMESFALSPLNAKSVLNDNTDIEEPRRQSWWKKLDENSQDVMEVFKDNKATIAENVLEEFIDIEVLSQEKNNFTIDLPESSDSESINSIVLPQRKLFTQKENQPQKKFGLFIGNRESLAKLHKTNTTNIDKTVNVGSRELFQNTKRLKPVFPAALLNISPDKSKKDVAAESKSQVRNIFGNRPAKKRNNIFADFIISESEDEIPDIQAKVFGFQNKPDQRRYSSTSKDRDASPVSSITMDMEMDHWKLLASSTLVENQLNDMVAGHTPIKRKRLSKLSEAKESELGTLQTNTTVNKTKQSNKSVSSEKKSKYSTKVKDKPLDNSRTTRSMSKNSSKSEEHLNTSRKQDTKGNKSQSKIDFKKIVEPQQSEQHAEEVKVIDDLENVQEPETKQHQEGKENINQSQEVKSDGNESVKNVANAHKGQDVEMIASKEIKGETKESQEVENISQSESPDVEDNESPDVEDDESPDVENDDASDVENDEEMCDVEEELAYNSQVNQISANISEEVENDNGEESQEESEAYDNERTEENESDQQMEDSDEADKAIASDTDLSEKDCYEDEEMEVDHDENEQEADVDGSKLSQEIQNEEARGESTEEIEESPNVRNRKKEPSNESPELILFDKTNQMDSLSAKGRNTSFRKTKSMSKILNIRPSLVPPRASTGFSDGTNSSSAEGSGWDSHRTTRKTLRQTFGKDFTPRKSLRALVMEKSVKRQTEHMDMHSETVKFPQANSTELPTNYTELVEDSNRVVEDSNRFVEDSNRVVEDIAESDHEISRRTRLTTLEMYLQKMKQQNIERKLKIEEAVRNSLKVPTRDTLSLFKVPNKPAPRRPKPSQSKPRKQIKSMIPIDELPSEFIEDMKYKPPKRFQPTNASWITKRLYKFLETKLEPKYDYKARVRAEKLVETVYHFAKDLRRHKVASADAVEVLKHELARLDVVNTHFEFYEFFQEFMPREVRIKVVPDIVNEIPLPRHGVFSDILRGNTV